MSLDFAGLDHNCNVVRRQMEEEFRGLSAVFILHKSKERQSAVAEKRSIIYGKPFGRKVYDSMMMNTSIGNDKSEFMGLVVNERKLFGFLEQKHYTAVFYINVDEFVAHESAKHFLLHMAWHALSLYQKLFQSAKKAASAKDIANKPLPTRIIKPSDDKEAQSQHNLQADIFGAIIMEAQGQNKFIEELAQRRGHDTLCAKPHLIAETLPYPIAYEACQLVYDDLKPTIARNSRLMHQAIELANEVVSTYGEDAIRQWWTFSVPAQTMAWLGYSESQILGYAIYLCENTDARAIAYQIAELAGIEAETIGEQIGYNAFGLDETNESLHFGKCSEVIQRVVRQAALRKNSDIFFAEALEQDTALFDGYGFGWCAPALIETGKAFDSINARQMDDDLDIIAYLTEKFIEYCTQTQWKTVEYLAKFALDMRREALDCHYEDMIEVLKNTQGAPPAFLQHFETQEKIAPQRPPQERKATERDLRASVLTSRIYDRNKAKEQDRGNLARFMSDANLERTEASEGEQWKD